MKGLPLVLLFTAMTFVAWGAYGPTLHHGSTALSHDSMRAFVGVGLAYFLMAVLVPLGILKWIGEPGSWTFGGVLFSLVAGAVGALGALGIILALGYGGETVFVMPVVFGFAPVVNTLVAAAISRTFGQIRPIFIAGVVTAALGAVGVLTFRSPAQASAATSETLSSQAELAEGQDEPTSPAASTSAAASTGAKETTEAAVATSAVETPDVVQATGAAQVSNAATTGSNKPERDKNMLGVILSIVLAAVCWGSYGPMLHLGQAKMAGSRLRPFTCVGIAYFLIAVIAPLMLIYGRSEVLGNWTALGMSWSFLAGVAGALGALGVILAFNAGGKPYYVMPLVFGFAPVINTFISLSEKGAWHLVQPLFWISLLVVIAGAVTVLITAPKVVPKPSS